MYISWENCIHSLAQTADLGCVPIICYVEYDKLCYIIEAKVLIKQAIPCSEQARV